MLCKSYSIPITLNQQQARFFTASFYSSTTNDQMQKDVHSIIKPINPSIHPPLHSALLNHQPPPPGKKSKRRINPSIPQTGQRRGYNERGLGHSLCTKIRTVPLPPLLSNRSPSLSPSPQNKKSITSEQQQAPTTSKKPAHKLYAKRHQALQEIRPERALKHTDREAK